MAEETGDKTEDATPRRREEAREKGQIPRSTDLTAAALLLGFLLLMNSFGSDLVAALRALVVELLSERSLAALPPDGLGPTLVNAFKEVAAAAAPLLLGVMVIAVVVNLAQTGLFLSAQKLQPNFGVLNPMKGLAKIFKGETAVQLLMNVLKIGLVAAVAWSAIKDRIWLIVGTQQLDFHQNFGLAMSVVYAVGIRIALLLLVLAILDYAYHRYKHEQELKMSKQDVKDEMRKMDGDPKIKQRRRQIAVQMHSKKLKKDVPTADVIVTNPTHYAVALKYDADSMHAPRVVAKGADLMAKRIREIAVEHGIPIVERPPLARAMYKTVEVGQEVPEQFYSAIAEILAYVYELTGKVRRKQSA